MNSFRKGFTLIELLVVIAIIGILSSVVLASLNSAREQGADANIRSNLNNARSQAELYYSEQNSYTDVCDDVNDNNISGMIDAATDTSNGTVNCMESTSGDAWAAEAELSESGTYYCADSTGYGGPGDGTVAGGTASPVACTEGLNLVI